MSELLPRDDKRRCLTAEEIETLRLELWEDCADDDEREEISRLCDQAAFAVSHERAKWPGYDPAVPSPLESAPSTTPQKTGETTRDRLVRDLVETKTPVPVATPRTDGAKFKAGDTDADLEVVTAEFSGQLERELAEVSDTLLWLNKQTTPSAIERKWIPVSERLPHTHSVLGCVVASDDFYVRPDDPMLDICTYFPEDGEWRISLGDSEVKVKVSHWMPLPEKPNNRADGGKQTA